MADFIKASKTAIWLLAFSFLILGLDRGGVLALARKGSEGVTIPLQFYTYRVAGGFSELASVLSESINAAKKLREERFKNAKLEEGRAKILVLEEENKVLKEQLGQEEWLTDYRLIQANTIGFSKFLTIDRGSGQGVANGDVVALRNNYIGQVVQISRGSAQVLTASDPLSKIAARTEKGTRGTVTGQFGTSLVMERVITSDELAEGQLVFTSGEFGRYNRLIPKHLILGRVKKVIGNPTEPFKKAEVEPLITYEKIDSVFVIKQ